MIAFIVVLVVIGAILVATVYSLSRDGYRRTPVRDSYAESRERYFANGGNTPS